MSVVSASLAFPSYCIRAFSGSPVGCWVLWIHSTVNPCWREIGPISTRQGMLKLLPKWPNIWRGFFRARGGTVKLNLSPRLSLSGPHLYSPSSSGRAGAMVIVPFSFTFIRDELCTISPPLAQTAPLTKSKAALSLWHSSRTCWSLRSTLITVSPAVDTHLQSSASNSRYVRESIAKKFKYQPTSTGVKWRTRSEIGLEDYGRLGSGSGCMWL